MRPILPNKKGLPLKPGGVPETTNLPVILLTGVAVKRGNVTVGDGDSKIAIVALMLAVGDIDGMIVAEGVAIPSTCSPLFAIVNFLVKITLLLLESSVVTVMVYVPAESETGTSTFQSPFSSEVILEI